VDEHDADEDFPPGGEVVDLDAVVWEPWNPERVAERLAALRCPWYVAGGWAIDLFLGEQTREHEDVEIAMPASGFDEARAALPDHDFDVIGSGRRWPVDDPAFDVMHQTWARDRVTGIYHLDVFREPHDGDVWTCRRDATVRRPYAEIVERTTSGVPFLAPEIVLLFKAKHVRPKDEADLDATLPRLDERRTGWLRAALDQVHPSHPWRDRLSA
jgi:hypothetical protein